MSRRRPAGQAKRSPVLVTGSHRSGTTWVGRMLAASEELHYVQEPFNIVAHQRWMDPRPPHQFFQITEANDQAWSAPVQRLVDLRYPLYRHVRQWPGLRMARRASRIALDARQARRRGAAALIKDPIAIFSSPWFVSEFDATAVVLVRDPIAFAGSLKERDWTFDFAHWSQQPNLVGGPLAAWADEIQAMSVEHDDIVGEAILLWNAIYGFVADFANSDAVAASPDRLQVISYEAIATDPLHQIEALYARIGLPFGDAQRRVVTELSSGVPAGAETSPIDVRRDSAAALATGSSRLDELEVERVRAGTAEVQRRIDRVLHDNRLMGDPR